MITTASSTIELRDAPVSRTEYGPTRQRAFFDKIFPIHYSYPSV